MHSSDREQLEVEASKAMKKLGSSKDFMESHLMRASVLTPLDDDPPRPEGAISQNASGRHTGMPSIESGDMADAAAVAGQANGGSIGAAGDEGEEHHALGMGATAVSVVVRGNRVVVANTGELCAEVVALCGRAPTRCVHVMSSHDLGTCRRLPLRPVQAWPGTGVDS
jgi:antitoxin (DNA-binding transcriptional repressor) of toxin-antitoxin stability system